MLVQTLSTVHFLRQILSIPSLYFDIETFDWLFTEVLAECLYEFTKFMDWDLTITLLLALMYGRHLR